MKKEMIRWFTNHYRQWESEMGSRQTVTAFGEYLGVGQASISAYLRGSRKPGQKTAEQIAEKLADFTILDILGYARPEPEALLAGFPSEFREPLLAALKEINAELVNKGIAQATPEAERIIKAAFAKHGVTVSFESR